MINAIAQGMLSTTADLATQSARTGAAAGGSGASTGDRLTLSAEALLTYQSSQTDKNTRNLWESQFGLTSGTQMLENGHRQVTTIEGSNLTVMEYDGDKLVRKETGAISGGTVLKDIEYYNARGQVTQRVHSELSGLDADGRSTNATLTRSAQWFDNGELTRQYDDSMVVDTSYISKGDFEPEEETTSLDSLMGRITAETVSTQYFATLAEYADGHLAQTATIEQSTIMDLQTNRGDKPEGGLAAHSTQTLGGESRFTVELASYDPNGALLRESSFTESIGRSGEQTQNISTTWYNDGEVVQKSNGTYEGQLGKGQTLDAEMILETLDLTQEQYSASRPLTAGGLLAQNYQELADAPEFFTSPDSDGRGQGEVASARNQKAAQNTSDPYSMTWTNEVYRDGELVARQEDTQKATENQDARALHFSTGTGLTEDESPRLLRESSHTDESYDENGSLAVSATVEHEEEVTKDDRGVYHLQTRTKGEETRDGQTIVLTNRVEAPLEEVDSQATLADTSFSAAADLTLKDTRTMLRGLSETA